MGANRIGREVVEPDGQPAGPLPGIQNSTRAGPGWPWCLPILGLALLVRLYWFFAPFTYDPITIINGMRAMVRGGFTDVLAKTSDRVYLPLNYYLLLIPGRFSHGPPPGEPVTPVEMLALRLSLIFVGVALAAAVYRMGRATAGVKVGLAGALLVALWPGSIYVDSWWAQNDIWYVALVLLACWWLATRRVSLAWLTLALAIGIKWQGALVAPVFALGTWRWFGWRRLLSGAAAAAALAGLLAAPIIWNGQAGMYLSRTMVQNSLPWVVEGAHNFWFAVGGISSSQAQDSAVWVGGITYRNAALALVALAHGLVGARLFWQSGPRSIAAAGALAVLSTTMFATQISTRHYMAAPALLLLASLFDRRWWPICLALMTTQIINLVAESGNVSPLFPTVQIPLAIAIANAWANMAIVGISLWLFWRPALGPAKSQEAQDSPLRGLRAHR